MNPPGAGGLGRIRHIARGAANWPPEMEHLELPPAELWVLGAGLPPGPRVAVVGARNATHAGLEVARRLGSDLAAAGIVVVSGMALGVDGAAHLGALEGGGPTVAVLGCGIDVCYPATHLDLRDRIAASGAVITEESPGTPPAPWRFPRRNRIIAALAVAVVVVEATDRSGALSTARHAADLGREVLAVPGSVLSERSAGPNRLIRDGATPVLETADLACVDALAEALARAAGRARLRLSLPQGFGPGRRAHPPAAGSRETLDPTLASVLNRLGPDPIHPDRLAASLALTPAKLAAHLAELELAGLVAALPGGLVARSAAAAPRAHTAPTQPAQGGG